MLLESLLKEVSKFVVSVSNDIRNIGKKYLSSALSATSTNGLSQDSMDKVYAKAICDDLVRHSLLCFQLIYYTNRQTEKKQPGDSVSGPTLYNPLQVIADDCYHMFSVAGLVTKSNPEVGHFAGEETTTTTIGSTKETIPPVETKNVPVNMTI